MSVVGTFRKAIILVTFDAEITTDATRVTEIEKRGIGKSCNIRDTSVCILRKKKKKKHSNR